MHLVYRPKFCITMVFNFSWVLQSSHEKSETMVTQNFRETIDKGPNNVPLAQLLAIGNGVYREK